MEKNDSGDKKSQEEEVKKIEMKKSEKKSESIKDTESKKSEVKKEERKQEKKEEKKETPKKAPKVMRYAAWAYCNLLGSSMIIRQVVARKFKGAGKKTAAEWKKIFEKEGLS